MAVSPFEEFRGTDRFVIERRLGAGGMGVVYQAYDRQRQDRVALKTFRQLDPAAIYRIKNEFRTLADVTHPNLVALYELISEGEQWFFTMQLVDGVDFLSYVCGLSASGNESTEFSDAPQAVLDTETYPYSASVERKIEAAAAEPPVPCARPLQVNVERLRHALRQLVEGVCALHRLGKLHRDIKPSNVLVTREGQVILLDFGLATELADPFLHESYRSHAVVGTTAYMSPEQAAGLAASPASDWYCVGVMLYLALTGRLPFTGTRDEVRLGKQLTDPPSPQDLARRVPDDLNELTMNLLHRDPDQRPGDEEMLRRVGSSPAEPARYAAPHRHRIPLVGRDHHLAALHEGFHALQHGRAAVVFVHGRSGVGKSVLVERFLESLRGPDVVILSGRCYEQESVPFKALDSLIDALSRYLVGLSHLQVEALLPHDVASMARVFPVLRRVEAVAEAPRRSFDIPDQQELRRRAFGALRELLVRLADRKRVVLAIDDLQWGDVDSANLIGELLRPPDPPLVMLLGSYRSEYAETSGCLRLLLAQADQDALAIYRRRIAVEPLTQSEAYELAMNLLAHDHPTAPVAARAIARESRGNPYFIYELVRYVQAGAELSEHSSSAENATLDQVLWGRVQTLPAAAYRLLEVIAVAAQPLRQVDAYCAAQLAPAERMALARLRSDHLVRSTGPGENDEVESYHDRIRETIVDHLSPHQLADCHRRLAAALEGSSHADPEALAIHLQAAGEDVRAGQYFAQAADQAAAALAFERAAKLYRQALDLQPSNATASRNLRTRLADALANAGRGSEAAHEYLAAATEAPAAEALELQRRAAMQSLISGHIDKGLQALSTVLDTVGLSLAPSPRRALWSLIWRRSRLRLRGLRFQEHDNSQLSAETLTRIDICWSAAVGLSIVDTIRGADFQAHNLLLSLAAGEPYRVARGLAWEAAHRSTGGVPARRTTAKLIDAADALARKIDHPHAQGLVMLCRGIAGYMEGRWRDGRAFSEKAEAIFREHCTGVAWELDTAHSFSNWSLFFLGEVAELIRRLPLLLQEARERGDLYAATNLGTFVGHLTWLANDDPKGAEHDLRDVMALWSQQGFHVQHLTGLMGRTQIALYRGDGAGAYRTITEEWPALVKSLFLRVQTVRIFMHDLRARSALAAAAQSRNPKPLRFAARQDLRKIETERASWSQPLAERLRAALALAGGNHVAGVEHLRRATEGFEIAGMGLYAASCRRCHGEWIGGSAGQELIRQAERWMEQQRIRSPRRMAGMYMPGCLPAPHG